MVSRLPDIPLDLWTGYIQEQFAEKTSGLMDALDFNMATSSMAELFPAVDPQHNPLFDAYEDQLLKDAEEAERRREEEMRQLEQEQELLTLEQERQALMQALAPPEPIPIQPNPDIGPGRDTQTQLYVGQPLADGEVPGISNPLHRGQTDPEFFAEAGDNRQMSTGFGKPYDPAEIQRSKESIRNPWETPPIEPGVSFDDYAKTIGQQIDAFAPDPTQPQVPDEPQPISTNAEPAPPEPEPIDFGESAPPAAQSDDPISKLTRGLENLVNDLKGVSPTTPTTPTTPDVQRIQELGANTEVAQQHKPEGLRTFQDQFKEEMDQPQERAQDPASAAFWKPIDQVTEKVTAKAESIGLPDAWAAVARETDPAARANATRIAIGKVLQVIPDIVTETAAAPLTSTLGERDVNPLAKANPLASGKIGDLPGAEATPVGTLLRDVELPGLKGAGQLLGIPDEARYLPTDVPANFAGGPKNLLDLAQWAGVAGQALEDPTNMAASGPLAAALGVKYGGRAIGRALGQGLDPGADTNPWMGARRAQTKDESPFIPEPDEPKIREVVDFTVRSTEENGGATYNLADGDMFGKPLYSVSIYPERGDTVKGLPNQEQLDDFIRRNKDLLVDRRNSVGTWFDTKTGETYLDIAVTVPDQRLAYRLGDLYDQKAIFDLGKGDELQIGGTGNAELPEGVPRDPTKRLEHALADLTPATRGNESLYPVGGPGDVVYRELKAALEASADGNIPAVTVRDATTGDVVQRGLRDILDVESAPDLADIRKHLQEGWQASQWYKEAGELSTQYIGRKSLREFGDLIGITTQSAPPAENWPSAMFLYGAARKLDLEGKPINHKTLMAEYQRFRQEEMPRNPNNGEPWKLMITTGDETGRNPSMIMKATELWSKGRSEIKAGSKSVSFDGNVLTDVLGIRDPNTTIDRHMYDMFGLPKNKFTPDSNQRIQAVFRLLGEELGVPPKEAQAAAWVGFKFPGLNTADDIMSRPYFQPVADYAKRWTAEFEARNPDKIGPGRVNDPDYEGLLTSGGKANIKAEQPWARPLSYQQIVKEGQQLLERDPRIKAALDVIAPDERGHIAAINQPHSVLDDGQSVQIPIHSANEISAAYAAAQAGKQYNLPQVEVYFPREGRSRFVKAEDYDRIIEELGQYYGTERTTAPPPRALQQPDAYYSASGSSPTDIGAARGAGGTSSDAVPGQPGPGRVPESAIAANTSTTPTVPGVSDAGGGPVSGLVSGGPSTGSAYRYGGSALSGAASGGVAAAQEEDADAGDVLRGAALGAARGVGGRALRGAGAPQGAWTANIAKAEWKAEWDSLYGDQPRSRTPIPENRREWAARKFEEARAAISEGFFDNKTYLRKLQESAQKFLGRDLTYDEMLVEHTRRNTAMAAQVSVQEGLRPAVQHVGEYIDYFKEAMTYRDNMAVAEAIGQRVYEGDLKKRHEKFTPSGNIAYLERKLATLERVAANPKPSTPLDIHDQVDKVRVELQDAYNIREGESWQNAAMASEGRSFSGDIDVRESQRRYDRIAEIVGPDAWKRIEEAMDMTQDFIEEYREKLHRAEVIDDKTLDALREYKFYIPTRILDYVNDEGYTPTGGSISLRDAGIHSNSIKGTIKEREDPIASLMRYAFETEARLAKNDAFNAFRELHEQAPQIFKANKLDHASASAKTTSEGTRTKIVSGFHKGKKESYEVDDEYVARALKFEKDPVSDRWYAEIFRKIAMVQREFITRSPVFIVGQIPLDFFGALVRESSWEGGPQHAPKVAKELIKAYFDPDLWRGLKSGEWKGDAAEMFRMGSGMAGFQDTTSKALNMKGDDLMRSSVFNGFQVNNKQDWARVIKWLGKAEGIQAFGQRLETAPRLAAYRLGKERALTSGADTRTAELRGMIEGRDVTLDFLRGGTATKFMNQFVPFFNIGFQSAATPVRAFRDNPVAFLATTAGLIGVPTMMAEVWNRQDAQTARDYEDIPDYIKMRNFIVMIPGSAGMDELGGRRPNYVALPMREFAMFGNLARSAAEKIIKEAGGNVSNPTGANELGKHLLQVSSPVTASNVTDLSMAGAPAIVSSVAQLAFNRDAFRNRQIATERNDEDASNLAKGLAEGLFSMGMDVRPSQIEFLLRDMGGNLGATAAAASDDLSGRRDKADEGAFGLPGIGGMVKRYGGNSTGQRLQEARGTQISPATRKLLHTYGMRTDQISPVPAKVAGIPLNRPEQTEWQAEFNTEFELELDKIQRSADWMQPNADHEDLIRKAAARARANTGKRLLQSIPSFEQQERKRGAAG